jgi:hypothetical protein
VRSAPRIALRPEIDFFQQVIGPGARTTCDVEPILSVAPLDGLVEIPRFYQVRATDSQPLCRSGVEERMMGVIRSTATSATCRRCRASSLTTGPGGAERGERKMRMVRWGNNCERQR